MKRLFYDVPDVEHMGDVNSEEFTLRKMGALTIVTDVRWGSEEIDMAQIMIEVPEDKVQQFMDYGCYTL